MRWNSLSLLMVVLALSSCASAKKVSAEEAFGRPAPLEPVAGGPGNAEAGAPASDENLSPERFVKQYRRGPECEGAARIVARANPDRGWLFLKACASKTNFNALDLLFENWGKDLQKRADGPLVVTAVLANRGGRLMRDLDFLASKRFPLFDLGTASGQPGLYKGKNVAFVGRVKKVKSGKGKVEVTVSELSAQGDAAPTASSVTFRTEGDGAEASFDESGGEVIVRTPNPDPFLTTGRTLVFLGRFESAAENEDADSDQAPATTVRVGLTTYFPLAAEAR